MQNRECALAAFFLRLHLQLWFIFNRANMIVPQCGATMLRCGIARRSAAKRTPRKKPLHPRKKPLHPRKKPVTGKNRCTPGKNR